MMSKEKLLFVVPIFCFLNCSFAQEWFVGQFEGVVERNVGFSNIEGLSVAYDMRKDGKGTALWPEENLSEVIQLSEQKYVWSYDQTKVIAKRISREAAFKAYPWIQTELNTYVGKTSKLIFYQLGHDSQDCLGSSEDCDPIRGAVWAFFKTRKEKRLGHGTFYNLGGKNRVTLILENKDK